MGRRAALNSYPTLTRGVLGRSRFRCYVSNVKTRRARVRSEVRSTYAVTTTSVRGDRTSAIIVRSGGRNWAWLRARSVCREEVLSGTFLAGEFYRSGRWIGNDAIVNLCRVKGRL